jgi:hypothetical protein
MFDVMWVLTRKSQPSGLRDVWEMALCGSDPCLKIANVLRALRPVLRQGLFWASVVFFVTFLLYVVGYGSEYWHERLDYHHGMWKSCTQNVCYDSTGLRAPGKERCERLATVS